MLLHGFREKQIKLYTTLNRKDSDRVLMILSDLAECGLAMDYGDCGQKVFRYYFEPISASCEARTDLIQLD